MKYKFPCSGAVVRTSDSGLKEPGLETCAAVSRLEQIVSLYFGAVLSAA